MTSTTKTPVTPEGLPVDDQRKLRRVVLGGSVGTSVLMALLLAFTGPGETAPAAALASASAPAELTPGAETYPIPPEAAAEMPAAPPAPVVDKEAPVVAVVPAPAHKVDSDAGKGGRGHLGANKQAAARGADTRATRGRGTVAASAGPARFESAPRPEAPTTPPAPDVKKRVPLVDEQLRVRILD